MVQELVFPMCRPAVGAGITASGTTGITASVHG